MGTASKLTYQEVMAIVTAFRDKRYPGKTIEEVLDLAERYTEFSVENAVSYSNFQSEVEGHLHAVYLCDTTDTPDDDELEYADLKEDMSFWRTGIRISRYPWRATI